MKRIILLSVAVAITMSLYAQQKGHRFAIKSGYVKYKLTGNTTGTKELWWDDYGAKTYELEQSKSETKIFGLKKTDEKHTVNILNKKDAWSVDYKENKGFHSHIPYDMNKAIVGDMTEEEQKKMADDILAGLGGRKLGTEKVLGYTCEGVTLLGTKVWVYKGVTLKTNASMLGIKHNQIAVEFKPNISIASSKFQPPKDIDFEENLVQQGENNLMNAFAEVEEEEAEEQEDQTIPVKYPYDKFSKKANAFEYNDYRKFMVTQMKGGYSAMFMKTMQDMIVIAASSKQNSKASEMPKDGWFSHKGNKYIYYEDTKEGKKVSLLMQDIATYDTYIIITCNPAKSKAELLKIADKLNF